MAYEGQSIEAGAKALEGGLSAMSSMNASANTAREKRRQRKGRTLLDLLRNQLSSDNETRESHNKMKDAFAELLANKAAHFRQSVS